MILAEIDKRMEERRALMEVQAQPIGRVLTKAEVETAKDFLVNIKAKWDDISLELKNELLGVILDRIIIHNEDNRITAEIIWQTGLVQKILI